jgi:hypothetical protein
MWAPGEGCAVSDDGYSSDDSGYAAVDTGYADDTGYASDDSGYTAVDTGSADDTGYASDDSGYTADDSAFIGASDGGGGAGGAGGGTDGGGGAEGAGGGTGGDEDQVTIRRNKVTFAKHFSDCMGDMGLPVPSSLFQSATSALATIATMEKAITASGSLTIGELIEAGTLSSELAAAAALGASFYAGACAGCVGAAGIDWATD